MVCDAWRVVSVAAQVRMVCDAWRVVSVAAQVRMACDAWRVVSVAAQGLRSGWCAMLGVLCVCVCSPGPQSGWCVMLGVLCVCVCVCSCPGPQVRMVCNAWRVVCLAAQGSRSG